MYQPRKMLKKSPSIYIENYLENISIPSRSHKNGFPKETSMKVF